MIYRPLALAGFGEGLNPEERFRQAFSGLAEAGKESAPAQRQQSQVDLMGSPHDIDHSSAACHQRKPNAFSGLLRLWSRCTFSAPSAKNLRKEKDRSNGNDGAEMCGLALENYCFRYSKALTVLRAPDVAV